MATRDDPAFTDYVRWGASEKLRKHGVVLFLLVYSEVRIVLLVFLGYFLVSSCGV